MSALRDMIEREEEQVPILLNILQIYQLNLIQTLSCHVLKNSSCFYPTKNVRKNIVVIFRTTVFIHSRFLSPEKIEENNSERKKK